MSYQITQTGMRAFLENNQEKILPCWALLGMGMILIADKIEKLTEELEMKRKREIFD